jgi:hypothetical protein
MGAEAVIGDALDPASVRAAAARIRPDAVINELTSLPKRYTPPEMKAAAERDSKVRREGNVNLLGAMREIGVRCYILQASGFWYAAGPGLADESSPLALDASPGVAASARIYVELESTAFRTTDIDCVAMCYGFFTDRALGTPMPVIWVSTCASDRYRLSALARAYRVSFTSMTLHWPQSQRSSALRARITSSTMTQARSMSGCQRSHALAVRRNHLKLASRKLSRFLAPIASTMRRTCVAPPTKRPATNSISGRVRSNGFRPEPSA